MAGYTELHPLVGSVLDELVRLRYSDHTVTAYRRMYANLERYAGSRGSETFDEELAVEFINHKFGTRIKGLYQAPPEGVHMQNYLRCMRVLLEWDLCGCVCKRMPGELRLTELPSGLQLLLDSFNAECRAKGLSESTVYSRNNRIKHFLIFLAGGGGEDAACITESSAHDYVLTKASLNPKSVKTILTAIRCFYRHIYLAGLVGRDLTATVPNPKSYYAPELPATWSAGDVDALLTSIDRGNPVGKRDYAMLLMVARLGLRASDIKAMRIDCFDWEGRRISIAQHKTGVPVELPLLDDVGWAVIDYLRGGRPAGATCPELFVRHNAPFDPFGDTSNLTYILSRRAQAAGVKVGHDRKTLHSLRHALAKRLLEQSVPIDDISRILGHVNRRTTSIYLRMDVEQLMGCPLDPEGGGRMTFSEIIDAYLAERRAVGLKMERGEMRMARICALHDGMGCAPDELPRTVVEAWSELRPGESETNRLERVSQIRCLAEYMVGMGYDAYVAPRGQGWRDRDSYEPHIFTNDEVKALFEASDRLAGGDLCCQRAQAALVLRLLYSTGMRCGEACSLGKADVDLGANVLTVRHAKNDKDRLVPVHRSVADRMRDFESAAALAHPQYGSHDRFWSLPEGRPLTTRYVYGFFRDALWEAGISHGGRGKGPRVHDLRFTFACHRLRRWATEGADVNALMPVLAAYMGHADTRCTEYYLRLTAELYPGMVEQVERECGWVVPS